MQRQAGEFLCKRSFTLYGQGGAVVELYELPNGQWQFGKGRDATVVQSMSEVSMVTDQKVLADIAAWLERTKDLPKVPVQQGQTPLLAGESVKDRLGRAINLMSEEVAARLLNAIEQTLGPVADSLTQPAPVNHHSDGFGQDQQVHAPGSVEPQRWQLPDGAEWADPSNPAAGYLTPIPGLMDDHGVPMKAWHPTPAFNQFVESATDEKSEIEREMEAERQKHADPELVGAGSGRRAAKPSRRR